MPIEYESKQYTGTSTSHYKVFCSEAFFKLTPALLDENET